MDQYGNFLHFPLGSFAKHQRSELGRHYLMLMRWLYNVNRILEKDSKSRSGTEQKLYAQIRMYKGD